MKVLPAVSRLTGPLILQLFYNTGMLADEFQRRMDSVAPLSESDSRV
jgi:hypothetical protein